MKLGDCTILAPVDINDLHQSHLRNSMDFPQQRITICSFQNVGKPSCFFLGGSLILILLALVVGTAAKALSSLTCV